VDDTAGFDGLQDLFDAFKRGEKLKPLFVP
jgi:hypothetical protein